MSRFLSRETAALTPYTPGEQPKNPSLIKLNTNESPYPPSPAVQDVLRRFDADTLRLYPHPDATAITAELADCYGLQPEQVLVCGGSDEALAFAFMAFCDRGSRVYFPDITYGFYTVYADLFALQGIQIPLREDFTIAPADYDSADGHLFIANPNAPTGLLLPPAEIEKILRHNPDRLVVVDEAYVDFAPAGSSCVPLLEQYDNLLVVQTFSKSRGLAGMRLGAAFGTPALIAGMNRIKFSFNPYNLDRVSIAVGIAAIRDGAYLAQTTAKIIATRERVSGRLRALGCAVLPSSANFLLLSHPALPGREMRDALYKHGILARHFDKERIRHCIRLTIGSDSEMDTVLSVLEELL